MNHLDQFRQRLKLSFAVGLAISNALLLVSFWVLEQYTSLPPTAALGMCLVAALALALLVSQLYTKFATAPLQALWQVIIHLSPNEHGGTVPDLDKLKTGRELVTTLASQIYQFTTVTEQSAAQQKVAAKNLHQNFIAQNLPLPLFVLDASDTITFANASAAQYIGIHGEDMIGKNIYMVLDMSFPSEDTFDKWLKGAKTESATSTKSWERIRLNVRDDHPALLFDLAAYYNRDNPDHHETMLLLFDHTKQYSQDEQAVSFIALSVHELRTPLTLLRGYIEVFEQEIGNDVDPELHGFMQKMHAQAEQLTAFVNNILNVARVESDQLELKLQSEDWSTLLKSSIEMISLRAKVRGIKLECRIATDLPPVAVDRLSVREVVNNLIDNAIKYSSNSKVIKIETRLSQEGLVETIVQDFGVGIPTSVMPNLFTKFYRDHRNRAQIGGTGLGLYLSKAIVTAHGGTLAVSSKEGEGSTFSFTLQPYAQLADGKKPASEQDITRSAHGWIKNHSLYRR